MIRFRPRPKKKPEPGAAEARGLTELGRRFDQCRGRARRLWRQYQSIDEKLDPFASSVAHANWSNAIDETLKVAEAISRQPAQDLAELADKFDAMWWWVKEDDSVLDMTTRRWLARFRKSLGQLLGNA